MTDTPQSPGAQDHLDRARHEYERATFGGVPEAVAVGEAELNHVEAALALARGLLAHARFLDSRTEDPVERELFERAVELFERVGDGRGEGEARFWLATYHQVVRDDNATAEPLLHRADALASAAGDDLTRSYVLRHLNFVERAAGRNDSAAALLAESTALRRRLGFDAGVAANLIGHAYLAAGDRPEEASAFLAEATTLAQRAGADGVLGWIESARTDLSSLIGRER